MTDGKMLSPGKFGAAFKEFVDQALFELTVGGGSLTKTLLGVQLPPVRRPQC